MLSVQSVIGGRLTFEILLRVELRGGPSYCEAGRGGRGGAGRGGAGRGGAGRGGAGRGGAGRGGAGRGGAGCGL